MSTLLKNDGQNVSNYDLEKETRSLSDDSQENYYVSHPFMKRLLSWGVEARGALISLAHTPRIEMTYAARHSPCPTRATNRDPL